MDMPLRTPDPVGWPFPWKGLLTGGIFLAAMVAPLGEVFGALMLMGGGLLFAPFLMVGIVLAGETRGPMVGLVLLGGLILFGMGQKTIGIVRADNRATRARLMNQLTTAILAATGLTLAALRFADAWRP